jgi:pimeloyl-ACP methyl ester carboxylesterase
MTPIGLDHEPEIVSSFDGTRLATRRLGEGDGLTLLLANAIGANLAPWRKSLVDIERQRTILTWDHRGLFDSSPPVSGKVDPSAQAEDAMAVVDHYDVDRFALAAWSNGTRIAIEIAATYPEKVAALVLVSGGFGHPASRLFRLELASAIPVLSSVAKYFAGPITQRLQKLVARPEITGLIRQSGMVGATADTPALVDLVRGMAECDLRTLLATFEAVIGDSGAELLNQIQAPTLLVVGDRDQFTSERMIDEVERAIPNCTVIRYEGATHYLPLEYPARLSDDIRAFFKDVGI